MANIHKISGYLVDPNGEYDKASIEEIMKRALDTFFQQLHIDTACIGEWEDDNPLNYINCDLAECEKWFSKEPTKDTHVRQVEVGAVYNHFKGHKVKVLAVSKDTEYVNSYSVVYEHLGDGVVWSRPYDMFVSEVDHEKYPYATQKYRFEKVS